MWMSKDISAAWYLNPCLPGQFSKNGPSPILKILIIAQIRLNPIIFETLGGKYLEMGEDLIEKLGDQKVSLIYGETFWSPGF